MSELRKSLESIQSLLSQAKSPHGYAASSSSPGHHHPQHQSPQDIFRRSFQSPNHQATPAAHRYGEADTPATHATMLAPHHPLYRQQQQQQQHPSRALTSSSHHSPYHSTIGSPSSAFEEFKRNSGSSNNDDTRASATNQTRSTERTVNFPTIRETSLLISPMETPGTARNNASPTNLSGIRTSLYADADIPSRESRSTGIDPPAKSPFPKQDATMQPASETNETNNASITSEVTLSMAPRTPSQIESHAPRSVMDEQLLAIASATRRQLNIVWDAIGVSPEERREHLSSLLLAFETLCREKMEEEEDLVKQFQKDIGDLKSEYEASCAALGLDADSTAAHPQWRRDPSGKETMSLQCEYEVVNGRVESVRCVVARAREDLIRSRGRIMEASRALNGHAEGLDEWRDVETDLTERRREEFRAKAVELEEAVVSRTKAVVSLIRDCQSLLSEMEIVVDGNAFGEDVVGNNQDDVKIMNSLVLQTQDDDTQSPNGYRGRASDRFDIVSLFETSTCMGISSSALERLTRRIAELNDEKKRRRNILAKMGAAIQSLWVMLRVPEEEQRAFSSTIKRLSLETIRRGEQELARLNERKAVMIGKLITDKRQEIEKLWEQTNTTDAEKAEFDAYFHVYDDEKLTEDLLTRHQEYASILNEKLEAMRPILDLIAKREAIVAERFELEQLQKDPERLKGRHACQQLAKEEKMHRRVKNELPRITNHLEKTLQKWYADNRPASEEQREADPTLGHFLYQGAPYLDTMHTQEHDWKMHKEIEEQDRKNKRDEERKAKQNTFGSSYSKLPGQKYKPSIGSTASSSTAGSRRAESRPRSASNVRADSNPRGGPRTGTSRPLADVSGSRGNVPRPPSRSRQGGGKPDATRSNPPVYRAASAPARQRF